MRAWHFTTHPHVMRDGTPWRVGEWEEYDGELVMCQRGLHASRCILDALAYGPGTVLRRVEIAGNVYYDYDKLVCSRRRALWAYDVTAVIKRFIKMCDNDVVRLGGQRPIRTNSVLDQAWSASSDAAWWAYEVVFRLAHDSIAGRNAQAVAKALHRRRLTRMLLAGRPRYEPTKQGRIA